MDAKQLAEILSPVLGREVKSVAVSTAVQSFVVWIDAEEHTRITPSLAELAAVGEMYEVYMKRDVLGEGPWFKNKWRWRGEFYPTAAHALVAACLATRKEGEHV